MMHFMPTTPYVACSTHFAVAAYGLQSLGGEQAMLNFPNISRSYDATRRCVRFWGHDGALEVSFFVEEAAVYRIAPETRHNQDGGPAELRQQPRAHSPGCPQGLLRPPPRLVRADRLRFLRWPSSRPAAERSPRAELLGVYRRPKARLLWRAALRSSLRVVACLRAAFLALRTASPFSRARLSDGFS